MPESQSNRILELTSPGLERLDELIIATRQKHPSADILHELFGDPAYLLPSEVAEIGIRAASANYENCMQDVYAANLVRTQELYAVAGVGRMAIRVNDLVTLDSAYQRLSLIGGFAGRRRYRSLLRYVQMIRRPDDIL